MPAGIHPGLTLWTLNGPRQLKCTSKATIWTSTSSHPTTTESMPPNVRLQCSTRIFFCPCYSQQELPATILGWCPSLGGTDPEPTTILPKWLTKSANKKGNGKFDYNKTPLAPDCKNPCQLDPTRHQSLLHWPSIKPLLVPQILCAWNQTILGGQHVATISNALHHTSTVTSRVHNTRSNRHPHRPWQHCPNFHQCFCGTHSSPSETTWYSSTSSPQRHSIANCY